LSKYWLNFKSSSNVVKEIFAYGNSHAFQTQTDDRGKKKDTDDYQFKSGILGQKAGLLTSGRSRCFPGTIWPLGFNAPTYKVEI
jgi:hypothetical protein